MGWNLPEADWSPAAVLAPESHRPVQATVLRQLLASSSHRASSPHPARRDRRKETLRKERKVAVCSCGDCTQPAAINVAATAASNTRQCLLAVPAARSPSAEGSRCALVHERAVATIVLGSVRSTMVEFHGGISTWNSTMQTYHANWRHVAIWQRGLGQTPEQPFSSTESLPNAQAGYPPRLLHQLLKMPVAYQIPLPPREIS